MSTDSSRESVSAPRVDASVLASAVEAVLAFVSPLAAVESATGGRSGRRGTASRVVAIIEERLNAEA